MTDFAVPNRAPGKCAKCSGTGRYRWAGATVNGVWQGKEGPCHSCRGTGHQDRTPDCPQPLLQPAQGGLAMRRQRECNCGSGLSRYQLIDARGIFCTYVCERCEAAQRAKYRPDIFTDPAYSADEPIEED